VRRREVPPLPRSCLSRGRASQTGFRRGSLCRHEGLPSRGGSAVSQPPPTTDAAGTVLGACLSRRGRGRALRVIVALIALHSLALGSLLLFAPRFALELTGFGEPAGVFFPTQSGLFLLILAVCYLLALREPVLLVVVLLSKACAVAFLVVHAAFLGGPPVLWLAALGDGAMLTAALAALARAPAAPSRGE
jgi:hypothetical protein